MSNSFLVETGTYIVGDQDLFKVPQESPKPDNAKAEYRVAAIMLDDLVDLYEIVSNRPWLVSQVGPELVATINHTKLLLNELQSMRLEPYVEAEIITLDLYLFLGVNDNNQRTYVNLKGFPSRLAGEFVEYVRHSGRIVETNIDFFDSRVRPELIKIGGFDLKNVFCNFDRNDPNLPQAIDPDWK